MSKKTLLLIAGVAIMLAAATSASAYNETWSGWFNSGSITYYSGESIELFDYTSGQGMLDDVTAGSVDTFRLTIAYSSTFTCAGTGNYIVLWHNNAHGWKYTGQSGQKEAYDGTWTGIARLYNSSHQQIQQFDVWGTWDTGTSIDGMYFNYTPRPPTYSAHWEISGSNPMGLSGEGGSAGTLQ